MDDSSKPIASFAEPCDPGSEVADDEQPGATEDLAPREACPSHDPGRPNRSGAASNSGPGLERPTKQHKRYLQVLVTPSKLRYVDTRRLLLTKGCNTIRQLWWPRPLLREVQEDCSMKLQVKVPLAAIPGPHAPAGAPGTANPPVHAPALNPPSQATARVDALIAAVAVAAAAAGVSAVSDTSKAGVEDIPMAVVLEVDTSVKLYGSQEGNTWNYFLTNLQRQLDPFIEWRMVMLERVRKGDRGSYHARCSCS